MLFTKTETLNSILLEKKKFIFPSLLFLYKEKFCSISKKKVNRVLSSLLLKEEGSFKLFLLNLKKLKNKDQKKLFLSKLFFNKGKNFQNFSHFFILMKKEDVASSNKSLKKNVAILLKKNCLIPCKVSFNFEANSNSWNQSLPHYLKLNKPIPQNGIVKDAFMTLYKGGYIFLRGSAQSLQPEKDVSFFINEEKLQAVQEQDRLVSLLTAFFTLMKSDCFRLKNEKILSSVPYLKKRISYLAQQTRKRKSLSYLRPIKKRFLFKSWPFSKMDGFIYVHFSSTNVFCTVTNQWGEAKAHSSGGRMASQKGGAYAAQEVGRWAGEQARRLQFKNLGLVFRGRGKNRKKVFSSLKKVPGIKLLGIFSLDPRAHNGCRPKLRPRTRKMRNA